MNFSVSIRRPRLNKLGKPSEKRPSRHTPIKEVTLKSLKRSQMLTKPSLTPKSDNYTMSMVKRVYKTVDHQEAAAWVISLAAFSAAVDSEILVPERPNPSLLKSK